MHHMLRKNRTLNDVSTNLGTLGALVGGNHLSAKETEEILKQWQEEVFEMAVALRRASQDHDMDMKLITGLTDGTIDFIRREEARRELNGKEDC